MKIHSVAARAGLLWFQAGVQNFFRQPLALTGLFLFFMVFLSLLKAVPGVGAVLALVLVPASTLGLMVATQEVSLARFPLPSVFLSGWRSGPAQSSARAMLLLGILYALGFLSVMGLSALLDGGKFAALALVGGTLTPELLMQKDFQSALWLVLALHLPLSLLFWHAPALVYWHGVPVLKSLFFSGVVCFKNFAALTVFGLIWMGLFFLLHMVLALLSAASSGLEVILQCVLAAMFMNSLYFTFKGSFLAEDDGGSPDVVSPDVDHPV